MSICNCWYQRPLKTVCRATQVTFPAAVGTVSLAWLAAIPLGSQGVQLHKADCLCHFISFLKCGLDNHTNRESKEMEDWSDFHKNVCASSTDKPSSGILRGIKHSYCPSAMNLGKNEIKLLVCKARSLSFTFHCCLSSFAMLSFLVLYFPIKNTSCSKQKDKAHVPPDKTQSPEWQQGKGSAGVPVTGSQTWSQTGGRNAVCFIPAHAEPSPGPFCFGQILFLMLIMVMGLWAKPNKQLYGFPLNKPDSLFLLFWCHPNAGMVINHREMCY